MTLLSTLPWPGARAARAPTLAPRPVWFVLGVLVILTFSQGWVMLVTGPDGDPEASGLIRAGYVPAYLAAAALAWSGRERLLAAAARAPLLWPPLLVIAFSCLWSIDREVSERRVVALAFTVLGGLALGSRFAWEAMVEVAAAAFAGLVAGSFLLVFGAPELGRMSAIFPGAWRGLWPEKNALGDFMAMGVVVFLAAAWLAPRRRALWLAMAAAALVLVLGSTSKTSLVTLAAALAGFGFVAGVRRGGGWTVTTWAAAIVALAAAAALAVFAHDVVFAALGKDATLTGRTKIWDGALREAATRPWTGFGYGVVWTEEGRWGPRAWIFKYAGFTAHHAHNSWIETYLGLGRVGLAAVALLTADVWRRALGGAGSTAAVFALPFLVVFSLTMLTESIMLVYNDFYTTLFVAVACALGLERSRAAP